jgi:alpha-galactosidase
MGRAIKRRKLMAGGTAIAASQFLSRAGAAPFDPAAPAWVLGAHGASRYVVRVRGAAVLLDCYGADDEGGPPEGAAAGTAMIEAGPERRPVVWRVATWHQSDPHTLRVLLSAIDVPLSAELVFAIDRATGVLSRGTALRHHGTGPEVTIGATLAFRGAVHEPVERMLYLAGAWAHEAEVRHGPGGAPLHLETRSGKTGFEFQPYVALRTERATCLCQILWSGNWSLDVTPAADGAVVSGGFNNWSFRHRMGVTGSLRLPTVLFGRFEADLNAATRRLHDWRRAHRPDPDRAIPVQFNSWYAYAGEPTAAEMLAILPTARRLGCEAFVVDAGWYRTDDGESAEDWMARTGDWRTSRSRFPRGLREISEASHKLGLRFGLWFEPEVIGPLSAIRAEHPEWLHYIGGTPPAPAQRAVLNLGVPAARQHVFDRITRILSAVEVDWMKWDFNADLGAGGWAPGLPELLTDQDPLVAHYDGLYRLQDGIRRWFPDLMLEMCSSGGGRLDGEIMAHAHVNWISDQPGPVRKLAIHFGCQLAHPAVICNDWLVEWPPGNIAPGSADGAYGGSGPDARGDLPFRLRVAMLGSFGISARADLWPAADLAEAAAHVALYCDKLRALIHYGDQYLLTPAPPPDGNGDWAAIWYAAKDASGGALFAFRLAGGDASRAFPLPGLGAAARYRAHTFGGVAHHMTAALTVTLPQPFTSEIVVVEQAG